MDDTEEIVHDGYVIFDVEALEEFTDPTWPGGEKTRWEKVMQTHKFDFNDISVIQQTDSGISVLMSKESNGQQDIYTWPWHAILHITHRTNSDEVSAKVRAKNEAEYAEHGMGLLEKVAQGDFIEPEEALAHGIAPDFITPCGHMSSFRAADHEVDIWTCLTCGKQWNSEGEYV